MTAEVGNWVVSFLALLLALLLILGPPALLAWYIYDQRTNTLWHPFDCVCGRCLDAALKKKVRHAEWRRRQREMDEAVAEMERAARGERR